MLFNAFILTHFDYLCGVIYVQMFPPTLHVARSLIMLFFSFKFINDDNNNGHNGNDNAFVCVHLLHFQPWKICSNFFLFNLNKNKKIMHF